MDPHKKKIIAGILLGLVILVWIRGLMIHPKHSQLAPSTVNTEATPAVVPSNRTPSEISRFSDWGGNPFEVERHPLRDTSSSSNPTRFLVSGILWDPKTPSAIINNQVVNVGDWLGQWRVLEIQKDKIILSDGRTEQALPVQ